MRLADKWPQLYTSYLFQELVHNLQKLLPSITLQSIHSYFLTIKEPASGFVYNLSDAKVMPYNLKYPKHFLDSVLRFNWASSDQENEFYALRAVYEYVYTQVSLLRIQVVT